jgi:DNA replication and repair protein RecF
MRVTRLSLTDFRSYGSLDLEFGPGVSTFVGPNGAGKTNIVEALRYLSILGSHRVATDQPLIRYGQSSANVRARVEKSGRAIVLEASIAPGRAKAYRINGSPAKAREVLGVLRSVVFAPEDLDLVKGDPSGRRRFLDELCVALSPGLAGDLADYDRVVRQRTALLKSARGHRGDLSTLDVWDERQASLGAAIISARVAATTALAPFVARAYADLADGDAASIAYECASLGSNPGGAAADVAASLLEAISAARAKEIERGVCLVGPHRDDLAVVIGDLPARGYASHGESWSAALALRLATYDLLTSDAGPDSGDDGEPVLILDDVFAELDAPRRAALASRLAPAQQVVVTAAVGADVPSELAGDVFVVADGEVTRGEA